ncbi:MAG: hypothetical protein PUE44_04595 [Bulleidia sp.]|nr:hypothetical protein [Bulleidia sp.]
MILRSFSSSLAIHCRAVDKQRQKGDGMHPEKAGVSAASIIYETY